MRKIITVILLMTLNSCGDSNPKFSNEFYLIWNDGGHDSFDLKNCRFRRKYTNRDTAVNLSISLELKREIFDILVRNKVMSIEQTDFTKICQSRMLPSFTDKLVIHYGKQKVQYVWDGSYNDCPDERSRWDTFNLDLALSEILSLLYQLPEMSEVNQTDIIYM